MKSETVYVKLTKDSDFLLESTASYTKIKKQAVVEYLPRCPLCRRSLLIQAAPGILRCPACGAVYELKRRESYV
jgi:ribosomal protein L37AE/L43A